MGRLSDFLPEKFFNPLACRNRQLYFDCADLLIQDTLSGEFGSRMLENDVLSELTFYFQGLNMVIEEEKDDEEKVIISSNLTPRENARHVLKYFRDCGWIGESELNSNSGDNVANVTWNCQQIITSVKNLGEPARKDDTSNQILNMCH